MNILNQTPQTKIYFWGCTHIFHDPKWPVPLWKSRGYNSVQEHADQLLHKINSTVRDTDVLFHLGDGFLNSTPEMVDAYLDRINCKKINYLFGNHESSVKRIYKKHKKSLHPNIAESVNIFPLNYKNITFWGKSEEFVLDGNLFTIQHFPLKIWDETKHGAMHLHSHCHGGLPSSLPDAQDGKILDVGVDVFPDAPVSLSRVLEIMAKKDIKKFDAHH